MMDGLAIVGVAIALAIIVAGWWASSSIDRLTLAIDELAYDYVQRNTLPDDEEDTDHGSQV